jgi:hypothetical protein
LTTKFPTVPAYRHNLAQGYTNLGTVLKETGRLKEAEEAYRSALGLWKQLVAEFPGVPEYRHDLTVVQQAAELAKPPKPGQP